MFFSVILAYALAAAFAFCGVVGVTQHIMETPREAGYVVFFEGLATSMWPLAIALALILLVQIAGQIERWRLLWTMAQTPSTPAAKPTSSRQAPSTPAPTPPHAPSEPRLQQPQPAVTPPVITDKPSAATPPPPAPAVEKQEGLNFFKLD